MSGQNSNITTLDQILDKKYGTKGQPKREEWEQQFESFRLGVLLEEARNKMGLTQEQLASKMKTTQSTIARLESGKTLPSGRTLQRIAEATGSRLKIIFEKSSKGKTA